MIPPEHLLPARIRQKEPSNSLHIQRALPEHATKERSTQLSRTVSTGEEAAIDSLIRAAAGLLQQRVDLRLASRLVSCFALDFNVFYLPFYAHVSLNFTRQQLRASAEELAQTAYAFAWLQLRDIYLFERIAEAAQSILSCFAVAQLSRLLLSFVLVDIQCTDLLRAAAPHLERLSTLRRLLAAKIPAALSALTQSSQVADLLVCSRRLQLRLTFSSQATAAEQLCLNDLEGQSFAAVLLALLPVKSLSPVFWQDAAASCVLRVLTSTPPEIGKVRLHRARGKIFSYDGSCPTSQDGSALHGYCRSLYALSPPAIVDCFVCFAAIFGAFPLEGGCGAIVATAEQHDCFAVALAALSHALCFSAGRTETHGGTKSKGSVRAEPLCTPAADFLQPADIVRMYKALRRIRSSWDVEASKWQVDSGTQRMPSSRSTGYLQDSRHVSRRATRFSEHTVSSTSSEAASGTARAEQGPDHRPGELKATSSVHLRSCCDRVLAVTRDARFQVSSGEARAMQDLRSKVTSRFSEDQSVACQRAGEADLHVETETRGGADADPRAATPGNCFISVGLAEWMTSIVRYAQKYLAKARYQPDQCGTDAAELRLSHVEDMATALSCGCTQKHIGVLLERALLQRFLSMLHPDAFPLPDMLSCAYSLFCLYPYQIRRPALVRGVQRYCWTSAGCRTGGTGSHSRPCSGRTSVSGPPTLEKSVPEDNSCFDLVDDDPLVRHREPGSHLQAASGVSGEKSTGARADSRLTAAASSATGNLSVSPLSAIAGDTGGSGVLSEVCGRVAAALQDVYVKAQESKARQEPHKHCRAESALRCAAGEKAVLDALSTLEPYQQHDGLCQQCEEAHQLRGGAQTQLYRADLSAPRFFARAVRLLHGRALPGLLLSQTLCYMIKEYMPALPTALLKALPRLSTPPLPAGARSGCLNSSWHPAQHESQACYTSPTVGAELERILRLGGVRVQVYVSTGLYTFLAAETDRPVAYLYLPPRCFQRMHSAAARGFCDAAAKPHGSRTKVRARTGDTKGFLSQCESLPDLSIRGFHLTGTQSSPVPDPRTSSPGRGPLQPDVEVDCAAWADHLSAGTETLDHTRAASAGTMLPHAALGSDGAPCALRSEVGATLRVLEAEGWQLVCMPFCLWRSLSDDKEKLAFLLEQRRRLLDELDRKALCGSPASASRCTASAVG